MIEELIISYLNTKLDVPTFAEHPDNNTADEFIIIEKTGGSEEEHINNATIAVQSYAPTLLKAAQLDKLARETLKGIIERDEIARVRLQNSYNFTDTTKKEYRYQSVFFFVYYE